MNKHELHGNARYLGGKVEKAVGDMADRSDWQVAGVKDQVAGGAEHLLGRAQSVADDLADATPGLIDDARETARETADRAVAATREIGGRARDALRGRDDRVLWAVLAALGGVTIGWIAGARRG